MKALLVAVLACAFAGQPLSASRSCRSAELQVEGLLMRPSTCYLPFVLLDPRPFSELGGEEAGPAIVTAQEDALPQGQVQALRPDYSGGVRLIFGYLADCGADVTVIGSYLRSTQAKRFGPTTGGIWEIFAHPNNIGLILYNPLDDTTEGLQNQLTAEATAKCKVSFQTLDVQAGARGFAFCYLWWRAVFGLHFLWLHHSFSAVYAGTEFPGVLDDEGVVATDVTLQSQRNLRFFGVGPRVGVDVAYDFGAGLGLTGRLHIGGVAGSLRHARFEQLMRTRLGMESPGIVVDEPLSVQSQDMVQASSLINARLGVNFTFGCYTCAALTLEFGYEFLRYLTLLRRTVFTSNQGSCRDLCSGFGLDGFYLNVLLEL